MNVDINSLNLETLRMVLEIIPQPDECKQLTGYKGDAGALDKPELLLRSLADIPRLKGRLTAMAFKAQMEVDIEQWEKQAEQLTDGCDRVKTSDHLYALFQVVLDVGNALNAGTTKGNAIGFRMVSSTSYICIHMHTHAYICIHVHTYTYVYIGDTAQAGRAQGLGQEDHTAALHRRGWPALCPVTLLHFTAEAYLLAVGLWRLTEADGDSGG